MLLRPKLGVTLYSLNHHIASNARKVASCGFETLVFYFGPLNFLGRDSANVQNCPIDILK